MSACLILGGVATISIPDVSVNVLSLDSWVSHVQCFAIMSAVHGIFTRILCLHARVFSEAASTSSLHKFTKGNFGCTSGDSASRFQLSISSSASRHSDCVGLRLAMFRDVGGIAAIINLLF